MKQPAFPERVVSGGQTGVDQAALTAALTLAIPHGGWCPQGRRCETGLIPSQFLLTEMPSPSYTARTRQNVIDSDATLILYRGDLSGGTLLTSQIAQELKRPLFILDLEIPVEIDQPRRWLKQFSVVTLNIAGPRESTCPGISQQACRVLTEIFSGRAR